MEEYMVFPKINPPEGMVHATVISNDGMRVLIQANDDEREEYVTKEAAGEMWDMLPEGAVLWYGFRDKNQQPN